MVPIPREERSKAVIEYGQTQSECEKLYGPYPKAIPVPFLNKELKTPEQSKIDEAKTLYDLQEHPDYRDVGTPDEWLPRDGRLVRLTGRHPFNCEPPLSLLQKHRFITPCSLHYVRNHGACPKLKWDEHTITIGGPLAPFPFEISMDELAAMPARELPVTLACAGNRRKEQNMVRQTIGFNWGPAGASTNVWRGVMLRDLLLRAGVSEKKMAGKHVEFIAVEDLPNKVGPGPFKEPWGKLVKYGTSIPLGRAMNPALDVIVAYMANGQVLQPDHGFPVRMIIPGYIGGRMIKWLKEIRVIPHETHNHYHYHDNRILPPHVTAEESIKGGWWYKPEYIFNELNINSVIASPAHDETISIAKSIGMEYNVSGYAYTGGGRRMNRIEVSIDQGASWHLAEMERKEQPNEYGKYWCWVWWDYKLRVVDMIGTKEIWSRAWDEGNNPQPINLTWNLMGMGNGHIYRVKINMDTTANGEHVFRFEHPIQPGQLSGGWMTKMSGKPESAGYGRLVDVQGDLMQESAAPTTAPPTKGKKFSMAEIQKHDKEDDIWIIIKNRVYDCTEYLELHPGGVDSITINAGGDATEDFEAIHSQKARKMLEKYYIGELDLDSIVAEEAPKELVDDKGNKLALNPKHKVAFPLRSKTVLSHDSYMLEFALPTPQHVLGLPVGKHIFVSAKIEGETVMRRYTPISSNHDVGCVRFVIKAYPPTKRFPRGGKMSQYLDSIQVGDTIDFRGPVGEFEYFGNGHFDIEGEKCFATHFNLIAGGTGITPVMQVASEILRNGDDKTRLSLVFACREEKDLLLRAALDQWATEHPQRFKVHYILSGTCANTWQYSTGYVDKPLFEEQLYPPGKDVYTLMCGPPVMLDKSCIPNLAAIGHQKSHMFCF